MPIEILMPALSPTMTEGNLAKWNIKEGDKIKSGQVIAEIETDKATMEVEAVDEGVIGKLLISAGTEGVKVNELIAVLLEEGESKKDVDAFIAKKAKEKPAVVQPPLTSPPQAVGIQSGNVAAPMVMQAVPMAAAGASVSRAPAYVAPAYTATMGGRVFASPLAKRVAAAEGVNLSLVQGTGPHGRVLKDDIEAFLKSGGAKGVVRRNPQEFSQVPNNNIRKVIARRLTEAKQTVPHFYLTVDVELDRLLDLRRQLNEAAIAKASPPKSPPPAGGTGAPEYKLSVNDLIIKASALALKDVPGANASWSDEAILLYNNIDVSVAVSIDGGLITPIIRNADQKSIIQISNEMKDLAARARDNKLKPEEFQGGGFSLSNLGMFGVKHFAAIINPPQGCILAVGAGDEQVVVRGGEMVIRHIMNATLSVDHRVVDGALGAQYLQALKRYIESPALLLV